MDQQWTCPECETLNAAESTQCAVCGRPRPEESSFSLPAVPVAASYTPAAVPALKKARGKGGFWVLLLLLLCVSGYAVFLYMENEALAQTIQLKEARIDTLEDSLSRYKADLRLTSESLDEWENAVNKLKNTTPGYGDKYFYADRGVVFVNAGSTRAIKLTSSMSGSHTISCDASSYNAYASFDQSNWYNSTTVTIHGVSNGLCILTFSAFKYSTSFKVLVIVE